MDLLKKFEKPPPIANLTTYDQINYPICPNFTLPPPPPPPPTPSLSLQIPTSQISELLSAPPPPIYSISQLQLPVLNKPLNINQSTSPIQFHYESNLQSSTSFRSQQYQYQQQKHNQQEFSRPVGQYSKVKSYDVNNLINTPLFNFPPPNINLTSAPPQKPLFSVPPPNLSTLPPRVSAAQFTAKLATPSLTSPLALQTPSYHLHFPIDFTKPPPQLIPTNIPRNADYNSTSSLSLRPVTKRNKETLEPKHSLHMETDFSKQNIKDNIQEKSYNNKSRINSSVENSYGKEDTNLQNLESERQILLSKWRSNYCETSDDITRKLAELENDDDKITWIRSSPADIYYKRINETQVESTQRLDALCSLFEEKLNARGKNIRFNQNPYLAPHRERKQLVCRHKSEKCSSSDSSSSEEYDVEEENCAIEELTRKIKHPYRLHPDIWHNETGDMNDGPLCRCSAKSRQTGIRHNVYPGEKIYSKCCPKSNSANRLHHYRITISPPTNFLTKTPTIIKHDQHEFIFEGFSLLSHEPIAALPTCKVIRFNIEYTIYYMEEQMPDNFTIQELDVFHEYLFTELLELTDFNLKPKNTDDNTCSCYHFLPRFVRDLPNNGKEVLAMVEVLRYLLDSSGPLVPPSILENMMTVTQSEWQNYVDNIKDMVVTNPGMRPCSIRVDQLDRNVDDLPECIDPDNKNIIHPIIVHFGIKPPQLSYVGNPEYQKAWREYVKFRHLIANMSKPSYFDKRKLEYKENKLQDMRTQGRMRRNITVAISSKGFYRTGIMCDIVQHAMLIPVLTTHLRVHQALDVLETKINYKFRNRYLLQLALTHPSYKENFGTNPDHARNSLTNCGIRQPEYGDRKIHYLNTRKRGINTLINIMSRFGKEDATDSNIGHNERLEFLGDAVVEFLSTIHLFFMFPELEEGGLATYRAAIVQNQHLSVLAKKLQLDEFMLYAHGSDLCHELELRHAMANCFEALMGALLLDGGIDVADKVFTLALFHDDEKLKYFWENYPPHPLQEQEPFGDRQWIESYQLLKDLTKFEDSIGVKFRHIRLLARAFTDRNVGFTHLTLGSNQRLEFLGDTVLQIICSEYLYRHFPEHHEGHLSLLRSSLVNNRTEAVVCDDLGMTQYAIYSTPKGELKTKDRADLLEAFLGALYVDRGIEICQTFCQVCLFPRLQVFIMNQDWNDPKSKLQQCCLTLRTMDGSEPDIPIYKVIESIGPTNTRVYTVAVYFRGKRLASATGHSIQQAEMNAAKTALENSRELFPQLDHQKRVIAKSIKRQKADSQHDIGGTTYNNIDSNVPKSNQQQLRQQKKHQLQNQLLEDESNLPKQYRTREDISSDELNLSDTDYVMINPISDDNSNDNCSIKKKHKKKRKKRKKRKSEQNILLKTELLSDICSSISDFMDDFENFENDDFKINNMNDKMESLSGNESFGHDEKLPLADENSTLTFESIISDVNKFKKINKIDKMSSNSSLESGEII